MPRVVNKKDGKIKRVGYVLAIPDVADLVEFRREFPRMLGSLTADPSKTLPTSAQIDFPDQANLEVLLRMKGGEDQGRDVKAAAPCRSPGAWHPLALGDISSPWRRTRLPRLGGAGVSERSSRTTW